MELKKFSGIANTATPESMPAGALVTAVNVDIDDAGHLRRRRGTTLIDSGKYHSIFKTRDDTVFAVKNGDLCRLNYALQPTVIRAGVGAERLHYVQLGDRHYAKSSTTSVSFLDDGTVQDWGVPHVPIFAVTPTQGVLPAGTYQVAVTYVRRSDGLEGGVSTAITLITLAAVGGLIVSGIPVMSGYSANVYVSTPNGEELYLAATGVTSPIAVSDSPQELGVPLRTRGKYPPPGRGPITKHFGRILIADGSVLWATDAYQVEQVDMLTGYKMLEGRITLLASVTTGTFIGTEAGIFFLDGSFESAKLIRLSINSAPDQVPPKVDMATLQEGKDQDMGVLFLTDAGVCIGKSDGTIQNMTNKVFEFPKASEAALLYRRQDGLNQFVGVSSHPGTPVGSARFGDYVDAEIIRFKGV